MEEVSRKTPMSSVSKKSCKSKGKVFKRNNSSISRRRKKKTLAKLVSQNSIHNIHCFPFPFADFFCGCGKDCGKDKNKIRKISSKTLSKIRKKERPLSVQSEDEVQKKVLAVEAAPLTEELEDSNEECAKITSEDAFAVLTEPLDFDKLRLSGNMKSLLASVKFTSIFGCANVPKTMSQIKILLDNNPALKTQLRHILGDNLKNENLKPVADLLAADVEEDVIDSSNDSSIRHLSISKSVVGRRGEYDVDSLDSSFLLSRKGDDKIKRMEKDVTGTCSRKSHRKCSSHKSDAESQLSLFAKIFSSVFRSTKPTKTKHRQTKRRDSSSRMPKKEFLSSDIVLDEEKMNDMREKYDEWYERSSEEVRERFRWEDYVRVTMYLNDINNAGLSNDDKTKEMLNLWLKKFSKEIHKSNPFEENSKSVLETEQISRESIGLRTTLRRLASEEMLNTGGGDVICRLNTLMKELVEATENGEEKAHGDAPVDGENVSNFSPDQPGCSKWFVQDESQPPDSTCKNSTATDEISLYQTLCASFIDKLSKHGSKENKSIMGARYGSEIPWQNKDFQVFCVPTIQTQFNINNVNRRNFSCDEDMLSCRDEDENISNEIDGENSFKFTSEMSHVSLEPASSYTNTRSCCSSTTEQGRRNNPEVEYEVANRVRNEIKLNQQKRVSFVDNAIVNAPTEDYKKTSNVDIITQTCTSSSNANCLEQENNSELKKTNSNSSHQKQINDNIDVNSCRSNTSSDLSYILEHNDERYKSSRESINYIKDHKCELVEILKYLLSLANQDSALFKPNEHDKISIASKANSCVGIQCKISEEDTTKNVICSENEENINTGQQYLLKSHSETGPRKVDSASESLNSDSAKLISSLSDSGVHSNSSLSSRRQFISLPDVLEGAPVPLDDKTHDDVPTKRNSEDSVEAKDSSSSNMLGSCLSTSVSCQASQTPDIDDISQISTSDLSESQFKIHETMSTTNFKHNPELVTTSSEKSRSSENTRSCSEIQESKVTRSRFKSIFKKSTKESKK